jgi:hypothetical protein
MSTNNTTLHQHINTFHEHYYQDKLQRRILELEKELEEAKFRFYSWHQHAIEEAIERGTEVASDQLAFKSPRNNSRLENTDDLPNTGTLQCGDTSMALMV